MALQLIDPSGVSVIEGMGAIGKPKETFRVYGEGSQREDKVTRHYTLMRENQTVAFVERMEAKVVTFKRNCTKKTDIQSSTSQEAAASVESMSTGGAPTTMHTHTAPYQVIAQRG